MRFFRVTENLVKKEALTSNENPLHPISASQLATCSERAGDSPASETPKLCWKWIDERLCLAGMCNFHRSFSRVWFTRLTCCYFLCSWNQSNLNMKFQVWIFQLKLPMIHQPESILGRISQSETISSRGLSFHEVMKCYEFVLQTSTNNLQITLLSVPIPHLIIKAPLANHKICTRVLVLHSAGKMYPPEEFKNQSVLSMVPEMYVRYSIQSSQAVQTSEPWISFLSLRTCLVKKVQLLLGSWMSLIWSLKYLSNCGIWSQVTLKIALLHSDWMFNFRKDNLLTTEP